MKTERSSMLKEEFGFPTPSQSKYALLKYTLSSVSSQLNCPQQKKKRCIWLIIMKWVDIETKTPVVDWFLCPLSRFLGFPCGSAGKESACNEEDLGLIPGLGRSPGEGKGCPLQYSGLENSMACIVHGVAKSQTRLSVFHSTPSRFW